MVPTVQVSFDLIGFEASAIIGVTRLYATSNLLAMGVAKTISKQETIVAGHSYQPHLYP